MLGPLLLTMLAGATHYDVRLTLDGSQRVLGHETIRFRRAGGAARWQKAASLRIQQPLPAAVSMNGTEVTSTGPDGEASIQFQYEAAATRGLRWLSGSPGLFSTFHCDAWMICDNAPRERVTLRLEIVAADDTLRAVGPGVLRKHWRDAEGNHWVFETPQPVQTYLLSFAVAPLERSSSGQLHVFAPQRGHAESLRHTAGAARFFRERTGYDAISGGYSQVFLPQAGAIGQEAAGLALMTAAYLARLEAQGDVVLMAHELAHQWWGVRVGIRSWSDFWLNEGFAEYLSLLYLRHVSGNAAFEAAIARLQKQMDELRQAGRDRPLHFEAWKDATEALGPIPYVKGALFLHRLRTETGDQQFWRAIAAYTRSNAGKLVDSRDFEREFRKVTGRGFDAEVWGVRKD